MVITGVGEHVVDALRRAESLFGAAGQLPDLTAASSAAESAAAITAQELGGAGGQAHAVTLAAAVAGLRATGDTERVLAERLTGLAEDHAAAAATARQLRESAEHIVRKPVSASGVDGDMAALRVLRAQVAAMQRLIAEQNAQAVEAAEQVRVIGYRREPLGEI